MLFTDGGKIVTGRLTRIELKQREHTEWNVSSTIQFQERLMELPRHRQVFVQFFILVFRQTSGN